ncbi:MAG TPA: class F sortase [Actinomycetes bacterium]|jgi:sortase (surface protein transpeptidase)|nr:class F sortase [Actinomycetes bacterium]
MTRGRSWPAVAVVALALLAGCAGAGAEPTITTSGKDPTAKGLDAARGFRSSRDYHPTSVPVRLRIPRIGVSSRLQRLGQAPDKTVEVPSDWDVAGWYEPGTRPGDPGSAVMLGHVDSTSGPAVFYRLRELRRGDQIEVIRADRSRARFAVQRIDQYDKQRFPTDDVYYPTPTPTLRLVTCGGPFDRATGHYRANVIVFARLRR